jgi:hypothetical protein
MTPVSSPPAWLPEIVAIARDAEARRSLATVDTGSVSIAGCCYLRELTLKRRPKVAIEIGTFVGASTLSMKADRVYTCDKRNCCGPVARHVELFHCGSTRMLQKLVERGVQAEFFFFDGEIQREDAPFILHLAAPGAVFAFDDHQGDEKGVRNVDLLQPLMRGYELTVPNGLRISPDWVEPIARSGEAIAGTEHATTIAVLAPKGWL